MAFEIRTKSGDVEEAKKLASEIEQKYVDRVTVSEVYSRRSRKSYQLDAIFDSKNLFRSYSFALKDLQREIRKVDPSAKVIEFVDEDVKRTRGQAEYPYKARITLTALNQKAIGFFDERVSKIAQLYGMKAEVLQSI
jgi:hypothetical protein